MAWIDRWREQEAKLERLDRESNEAGLGIGLYNRDGQPISLMLFGQLFEDEAYKQIARTELLDGQVFVSTIWLGTDHNHFGSPPVIFETMVFGMPEETELFGQHYVNRRDLNLQWQYETEEQALIGHGLVVTSLLAAIDAGLIVEAQALDVEDFETEEIDDL